MIINNDINKLIDHINSGNIICFKTDTIWGFSANAKNEKSIKNLYRIKNRNLDKPFIFLIKENQDLNNLVDNLNEIEKKLIKTFWPGPLTIIFNAKKDLDFLKYYQENKTIALRMPKDKTCQFLLSNLDFPLPSTSVNYEGQKPLNCFNEIINSFKDEDFAILKDNTNSIKKEISSTIVRVVNNKIEILREGEIKKEKILSTLA